MEGEDKVDKYEDMLGAYLVQLNTRPLSEKENQASAKYLTCLGNIERISDHAVNLAELAKELQERFSISEEKMTFAANTIEETEVRIQNTPYGNVRFFGRNYKELDDFVTYFNRNLDKFSKNVEKIDESIAETIFESLKIIIVEELSLKT